MARATQVLKVVVGTLFGATLGFYIEGEYHIYRKVLKMIDFFPRSNSSEGSSNQRVEADHRKKERKPEKSK